MIESNDALLVYVLHELRKPVTTIALWEQLMREQSDDPDVQRRGLDAIRQSTQSQSRLIKDLLDLSRALRGDLRLYCATVQAQQILERTLQQAASRAAAAQVTVTHTTRQRLGRVTGDVDRLCQIVSCMLTRAIEQTAVGQQVSVQTVRRQNAVSISVTDMGPGMTVDVSEQLNDLSSIEMIAKGGHRQLELLLCRSLASLHGGTLMGNSQGVGHGSTWTLTIPSIRTNLQAL